MTNDNLHMISAITDKTLYNMILGNGSSKTRILILDELLKQAYNANQLSKKLKLDYKTIRYHMEIICKYQYATEEKFGKYTYYHPGDKLIKHLDEYILIKEYYENQMFKGE